MAFIEDILDNIGCFLPIEMGDKGVIINSHKGILKYSEDEIQLRLSKRVITIKGKCLKIKNLGKYEVYIVGQIEGVYYEI